MGVHRRLVDTATADFVNMQNRPGQRFLRALEYEKCPSTPKTPLVITLILRGSVPGGIRTPNLLIRSQKLYPVELQAQRCKIPSSKTQNPKVVAIVWCLGFGIWSLRSRVADGTRTRNNQNHNLGLYH